MLDSTQVEVEVEVGVELGNRVEHMFVFFTQLLTTFELQLKLKFWHERAALQSVSVKAVDWQRR